MQRDECVQRGECVQWGEGVCSRVRMKQVVGHDKAHFSELSALHYSTENFLSKVLITPSLSISRASVLIVY